MRNFGPSCTISHKADGVPKVPTDGYVSHMAGCLVPFAAREGARAVDDALKLFDAKARDYWASKSWADEYTRRLIQLGRVDDGEACNVTV